MKFSGRNFQAWQEFSLDISGLTVITGPSDKGKSAIFRALRGIFYNELPEAFIRDGQDSMLLAMEIDGHHIVAKRKKESSSAYTIDGKEFVKLAGKRPDDLKAIGINEIRIGDTKLDPIFACQNDTQFLIQGVSPTELNNILGGFASTEKLEYGKREANLRISQKNSEAKTLAVEVQETEVRKAQFEQKAKAITPIELIVNSLESKISTLEEQLNWLVVAEERKENFIFYTKILRKVQLPEIQVAQTVLQKSKYSVVSVESKENLIQSALAQQIIETIVTTWHKIKKIYLGFMATQEISSIRLEQQNRKQLLGVVLVKETQFEQLGNNINSLVSRIKTLREYVDCLGKVDSLKQEEFTFAGEIVTLNKEETILRRKIESLTDKMVTCPECGEKFLVEHEHQID